MEELEAISRLKQGDIAALEILVRKYQVQAIRAAYLITKQSQLAEDIVQSAFLRAYERINQYNGQGPSDFGAWFGRIVTTQALNAVSSRHHSLISLDRSVENEELQLKELLADTDPEPLEMVTRAETTQDIERALEKLSAEQRSVIVLRYYLELSEVDMAQRLACPPGTVKWRLHAARERLKTLLRDFSPRKNEQKNDDQVQSFTGTTQLLPGGLDQYTRDERVK